MDLYHLTTLARKYCASDNAYGWKLPQLTIYRRDKVSAIEATIYDPVLCLILQGSKVTSIGDQYVELNQGDALVVSHDLPVASRITKANQQEPYIAVILSLDFGVVRGLYDQVAGANLAEANAQSLSTWQAEPTWVEPLTRYVALMENPMDARVLGPSILREIHYRLLLSPIGGMLRRLLVADSHASLIAKAIDKLRHDFRTSISVSDLAHHAGMSPSSFHEHFKSVTGTTPIQYQKDLRLIEARSALVERGLSVSETAYSVGYESPTHFSRDYRRKFRVPPSRDVSSAFQDQQNGSI
ncbi:AraC family transcriptional regulator [Octadecabacter sp. CECT 8868]|uniref:AraC family transcriptional regulator n=1 Tax=Octadecabacter algicola TaxID=2909342 RepID=UPI001F2A7D33|nr:AraC family transcriptional regulator [Octadecabacter algicola]MCF2904994.1 AraC family transcriptional regulator [Octadecabacter algicola]